MNTDYIFYNEPGTHPISYVGEHKDVVDIESSIHLHTCSIIDPVEIVGIISSHHRIISTAISVRLAAKIHDSIHRHYIYPKYNAPVNPICSRYLDTPYESTYLETPNYLCNGNKI